MPSLPGFVGGTYQAISPTFAADTAVNVYLETRQVPESAKQRVLIGTPGLKLSASVSTNGMRGEFTQDGRSWAVVGGTLYERIAGAYVPLGFIPNDGLPVSFQSNGRGGDQLGICGGSTLTVLNLNTGVLTVAVLPFSGPVMLQFIDGYGLLLQRDSPIVWYSNLENFLVWDSLDFFARSNSSDNLVGIVVTRDRVWCLGSKTSTLFYNSGDTDTPFLPYPGTTIQEGLVSPWLVTTYADQVVWVARTARGLVRVVMATDAQPAPISTPPIDLVLQGCTTLDDAELLIYEQDAHVFLVMTCPSATTSDGIKTYSYDLKENFWHARAGWDSVLGVYTRWRGCAATSIDGLILVGDYANGNIYELDLNTYTDNGAVLKRERTTPYIADENQWFFLDQLELGVQSGVGLTTGQGSAPVVNLEISRNAAQTWVDAGTATIGAIGQYLARAIWRRLGRFRSDRAVFRVTQTDPVRTVWTGLWPRISAGTGGL